MSSRTATGTAASWCWCADGLRADGSTACGAAFLAGLWSNGASAADGSETTCGTSRRCRQGRLGLFPGWGFTWPGNVRVRGNRASANLAGQLVRERNLLTWEVRWACSMRPISRFCATDDGSSRQPGLPRHLGAGGPGVRPVGRRACARALRTVGVPVEQSPERGYAPRRCWRPPQSAKVDGAVTAR